MNLLVLASSNHTGHSGLRLLGFNPSIRIIKGTIFKENIFGKIRRPRLISIRWNFVWGKGTRFKEFFGGTNPENRDIQCIPIHIFGRGPIAPMTRECIPILLEFQEPQSFF